MLLLRGALVQLRLSLGAHVLRAELLCEADCSVRSQSPARKAADSRMS